MQVTIAEWTRRRPFRASALNGHRRVPSAGGHYGRHLGLTNHTRDTLLINQWNSKINDNLETVPNIFTGSKENIRWIILCDFSNVVRKSGQSGQFSRSDRTEIAVSEIMDNWRESDKLIWVVKQIRWELDTQIVWTLLAWLLKYLWNFYFLLTGCQVVTFSFAKFFTKLLPRIIVGNMLQWITTMHPYL